MVQEIPGDGKLGQADLINSWSGESLFGFTQTVLQPEVRYSLTLQVSQYNSVLLNQGSWELKTKKTNEDADPSVHVQGIWAVIGHWYHWIPGKSK